MKNLEGQVVVVTGGGRGIGRATALALAEAGAAVAICSRTLSELEETVRLIGPGGQIYAEDLDVTDAERVKSFVANTESKLGPITAVVNNAGIGGPVAHSWEMDVDEWWQVQRVNLLAPFIFIRNIVPGMIERGEGRIINVASYAGVRPSAKGSAYPTSKAALMRLSDSLAAELEGKNVFSFAISPGLVRTAMVEQVPFLNNLPPDQFSDIELGAKLIVRLVAGEADALSGLLIHVTDPLDDLIAHAEHLHETGLYQLRMWTGLEEPAPI